MSREAKIKFIQCICGNSTFYVEALGEKSCDNCCSGGCAEPINGDSDVCINHSYKDPDYLCIACGLKYRGSSNVKGE